MLNQEPARLWAEALESGKYNQIAGRLKDITDNGRCCLGVACDVYIEQGHDDLLDWDGAYIYTYDEGQDGDRITFEYAGRRWVRVDTDLPLNVQRWLGVDDEDPILGDSTAIDLNDNMHVPFSGIARLVREAAGLVTDQSQNGE